MVTTFCVSGAVIRKAGAGINMQISGSTLIGNSEYVVDEWINEAEAFINVATRKNWIDVYSTLNADTKLILRETAANLAAIYAISFDMSGFPSRVTAEDKINVLRDAVLRNISILRDEKVKDFITKS